MKYFALFLALLLIGCRQPNYATFNGYEQGTTYTIMVKDPTAGIDTRIDSLFDTIDATFSMFDPQSLVSRINRNETVAVMALFIECFDLAEEIHSATDGYFDPTVKPLVDAWGFGPGDEQETPCVECLMEYVGMNRIRIDDGHIIKDDARVQLDFSSIAKGFTVDKLAEMLEVEGVTDYMVEVGGEVRARGVNAAGRPWRIGIDKPVEGLSREYEAVVSFERAGRSDESGGNGAGNSAHGLAAIATSGNYRNRFIDETGRTRVHTIDPKTGLPAQSEILSVSIVAPTCAMADGWATGIMASGSLDTARRLLSGAPADLEYYIIYASDETTDEVTASFHSPGFPLIAE